MPSSSWDDEKQLLPAWQRPLPHTKQKLALSPRTLRRGLICLALIIASGALIQYAEQFERLLDHAWYGEQIPKAIRTLPDFPDARTNSTRRVDWFADRDAKQDENLARVLHVGQKNYAARQQCVRQRNCRLNQEKVIIVADISWINALMSPYYISGEQIWSRSLIQSLDDLNYTRVYESVENLSALNKIIAEKYGSWDAVHMVIASASQTVRCAADPTCVYSRGANPRGAKLWKTLAFHFWAEEKHPLGGQWILNPENYGGNNRYLGYSVERKCMNTPYIEPKDRYGGLTKAKALNRIGADQQENASRRVAYVLAKQVSVLERHSSFGAREFKAVYDQLPVRFELGATNDSHTLTSPDLIALSSRPDVFANHGLMAPEVFPRILSTASILVGVGLPGGSPTPYDALCLGVPFLNPIMEWDHAHPLNRASWKSQHDTLKHLDPPYVYNVYRNDTRGFVEAIRAATTHPIERYILPLMRQSAVTQRFSDLLDRDHYKLMHELMRERKRSGRGKVYDY